MLDYTSAQVNEFAFKALTRRLKAIGVSLQAGPGRASGAEGGAKSGAAEEPASDAEGVPA
jgi:hypothetical protein